MIFSSVDLPQPDGPIILRNSPLFTSRFTFSKAIVSISFVRYTLCTFVSLIISMLYLFMCSLMYSFARCHGVTKYKAKTVPNL